MTEKYTSLENFSSQQLTATLKSEASSVRDVAHGEGEAVGVAEGKLILEVYPGSGVARVTTSDARVELFRIPGYTADAERGRVVFEQVRDDERTRLIVQDDGRVSFHPVLRAPEQAVTARTGQNGTVEPPPVQGLSTSPTEPEAAPEEERATTELTGRLGRDPWFRGGDEPAAGFPLAVNGEDGNTTWHKVVVFDAAAQKLSAQSRAGELRKGRLVAVAGEHVMREEQTDKGVKKHKEFHATEVNRVRSTSSRPSTGSQR
jgi:hypothetical protein